MTNRNKRSDELLILHTLRAIFELQRADHPVDANAIALRIGSRPVPVGQALVHLEDRGLVDAGRAGLTMGGLVVAAGLAPLADSDVTPIERATTRRAAKSRRARSAA